MIDRAARPPDDGKSRQLTFLYKTFMIFLISFVLDRASSKHLPHDLLFFIKAKISRRVVKLGTTGTEAWYSFPNEVLRRIDTILTKSWDTIQSPKAQALPLSHLTKLDID